MDYYKHNKIGAELQIFQNILCSMQCHLSSTGKLSTDACRISAKLAGELFSLRSSLEAQILVEYQHIKKIATCCYFRGGRIEHEDLQAQGDGTLKGFEELMKRRVDSGQNRFPRDYSHVVDFLRHMDNRVIAIGSEIAESYGNKEVDLSLIDSIHKTIKTLVHELWRLQICTGTWR